MSCRHTATYGTRAEANAAINNKRIRTGLAGNGDKGWKVEGCSRCDRFIVTTRRGRENRRQQANRRS